MEFIIGNKSNHGDGKQSMTRFLKQKGRAIDGSACELFASPFHRETEKSFLPRVSFRLYYSHTNVSVDPSVMPEASMDWPWGLTNEFGKFLGSERKQPTVQEHPRTCRYKENPRIGQSTF